MKKLLGIVVLGLLWCNVGFASTYFFDQCRDSETNQIYSAKIDTKKNNIYITLVDPDEGPGIEGNVEIKNIVGDHKILSQSIHLLNIISSRSNLPSTEKFVSNFVTHQFEFYPNDKKIVNNMIVLEPRDKKSKKKLLKWGFPHLPFKVSRTANCRIVEAKIDKPKKTEPQKSPDDNKIVAAASGTGFFVSRSGHIITNHHVIDQCKVNKVNFKGNELEAKVLAIDKTNDLAILQANITPGKVYSVSNEDVSLLQDIIVAGFPLGKKVSAAIKTHKGSVSALAGFGDNYSNFQTDATINQGNSGGPVMDQKGNIVGVAVALMSAEAGQNIFFAVKSSTLKTFASSNGLSFLPPNNRPMSNKDLGQLITEATVFLECWMTVAKIKQIIAQEENRKAFYSEFK